MLKDRVSFDKRQWIYSGRQACLLTAFALLIFCSPGISVAQPVPPKLDGIDISTYTLSFQDEFDSLNIGTSGSLDANGGCQYDGATTAGFKWAQSSAWWKTAPWWPYKNTPEPATNPFAQPTNYDDTPPVPYVKEGVLFLPARSASSTVKEEKIIRGSYFYTRDSRNLRCGFGQKYGYFEVSMKVMRGRGLRSSVWALSTARLDGDLKRPQTEIDFPEAPGTRDMDPLSPASVLSVGTHDGVLRADGKSNGGHLGTAPLAGPDHIIDTGVDLADDFHTFGAFWEPGGNVSFFLDGKEIVAAKNVMSTSSHEGIALPRFADVKNKYQPGSSVLDDAPMSLILSAVGYDWINRVSYSGDAPGYMQVDYIRAWKNPNGYTSLDTTGKVVCTPTLNKRVGVRCNTGVRPEKAVRENQKVPGEFFLNKNILNSGTAEFEFDFGDTPLTSFDFTVYGMRLGSSNGEPQRIQLVLDEPGSVPVTQVALKPALSNRDYAPHKVVVHLTKPISGRHKVYLKGEGDADNAVIRVESFRISSIATIVPTPTPTRTPTPTPTGIAILPAVEPTIVPAAPRCLLRVRTTGKAVAYRAFPNDLVHLYVGSSTRSLSRFARIRLRSSNEVFVNIPSKWVKRSATFQARSKECTVTVKARGRR